MPSSEKPARKLLQLLPIALMLTACASPPRPLPTEPPRTLPLPADLSVSESPDSQDYSQRVRAWLKKVRAELEGLTRE